MAEAKKKNGKVESESDQEFCDLLDEHLRAGYQCMQIVSSEEARLEVEIGHVARNSTMGVIKWDIADGFTGGPDTVKNSKLYKNPLEALNAIGMDADAGGPFGNTSYVFIFRDLDDFLQSPEVRRRLRTLCESNKLVNKRYKRPLIITSPINKIHEKVKSCMTPIEFNLPGEEQLRKTLKFVCSSIESDKQDEKSLTPELADKLIACLMGLTSNEAENALSRCLVKHGGFCEGMLATIKDEKATIIKKSEVLTYIPESLQRSKEEIGGFGEFMEFIDRRKLSYGKDARAIGLDFPKGVVLLGPPGCVADDTMVAYRRGKRNSARRLSIRDFHDKFNGTFDYTQNRGAKWKEGIDTFLQSFNAETGRVQYNLVKGVYDKGEKQCLLVSTDTAGGVTLTVDHPVLNGEGIFVPAGALTIGDEITVQGNMLPQKNDAPPLVRRPRVTVEGLKYHPHGWLHSVTDQNTGKVYEYQRQHRARLVIEAHMNGMEYDEFISILKTDADRAEDLVYLDPTLEVHHQDEDSTNDELSNLAVMTKSEHTRLHCDESRFNVEYTRQAIVTGVENVGTRRTYDVSMERPTCNFVVNDGIIVHNTGKSLVGKAACQLLGLPGYIMDVGSVFGSLVGESEQRMRDALKQIEAQKGCVLLLDEADKAFGGATDSQGDSGVTRRVFGQLLTWLSEKQDRTFVIMTMNRTKGIPPEFLRAGRFDAVFCTDLPNERDRTEILKIHLKQRGVDPEALMCGRKKDDVPMGNPEWAELMDATKQFVGSELEEVIREARYISFEERGSGNPNYLELCRAAKSINPLAVLDKEGVDEIRKFCKSRARPVSIDPITKDKPSRKTVPDTRSIDLKSK